MSKKKKVCMYVYYVCIKIIYSRRSSRQLLDICIPVCTQPNLYAYTRGSQGPDEKLGKKKTRNLCRSFVNTTRFLRAGTVHPSDTQLRDHTLRACSPPAPDRSPPTVIIFCHCRVSCHVTSICPAAVKRLNRRPTIASCVLALRT